MTAAGAQEAYEVLQRTRGLCYGQSGMGGVSGAYLKRARLLSRQSPETPSTRANGALGPVRTRECAVPLAVWEGRGTLRGCQGAVLGTQDTQAAPRTRLEAA